MSSTTQANTDTMAADWGFWGFVGGTTVAVEATVVGGASITAWVCTKCLFTGITAGAAAFGLKGSEIGEKTAAAFKQAGINTAKKLKEKAEQWSNICLTGGVSLLGAGLSSLNYCTVGKDCRVGDQNDYCDHSKKLFYLTTSVCAAATIAVTVLSVRYLRS